MSPALLRRAGFIAGILIILGTAVGGTVLQRRSVADYSSARVAVLTTLHRYAAVLHTGESHGDAVRGLRAAGADVPPVSAPGDIVVTVLRELHDSPRCRSVVGQLHVSIDAQSRVSGWEIPVNTACD
ncbi:MAG: hypothetical protein NVSMB5_25490 [Candidatus Velthaea sp.]